MLCVAWLTSIFLEKLAMRCQSFLTDWRRAYRSSEPTEHHSFQDMLLSSVGMSVTKSNINKTVTGARKIIMITNNESTYSCIHWLIFNAKLHKVIQTFTWQEIFVIFYSYCYEPLRNHVDRVVLSKGKNDYYQILS